MNACAVRSQCACRGAACDRSRGHWCGLASRAGSACSRALSTAREGATPLRSGFNGGNRILRPILDGLKVRSSIRLLVQTTLPPGTSPAAASNTGVGFRCSGARFGCVGGVYWHGSTWSTGSREGAGTCRCRLREPATGGASGESLGRVHPTAPATAGAHQPRRTRAVVVLAACWGHHHARGRRPWLAGHRSCGSLRWRCQHPFEVLRQHIGSVWLMLSTSTVQHHPRQGPPPSSRGISCGDPRVRRGGVRGGAHVG